MLQIQPKYVQYLVKFNVVLLSRSNQQSIPRRVFFFLVTVTLSELPYIQ